MVFNILKIFPTRLAESHWRFGLGELLTLIVVANVGTREILSLLNKEGGVDVYLGSLSGNPPPGLGCLLGYYRYE